LKDDPTGERISLIWSPEARNDLRAIDRDTAMQILYCLDRYIKDRVGDVKKLKPPFLGLRLRCGDYRVFFDPAHDNTMEITGVRHRRDAYR
jgi:mRNA-degrading endonuclease RelE of RelBE toxin-antitoxin system